MTVRDLARRLGLPVNEVMRVALQVGIAAPDGRTPLTNEDAWNIEKEIVKERGGAEGPPLVLVPPSGGRRSSDVQWCALSELTKLMLKQRGIDYSQSPKRYVPGRLVDEARYEAEDWADKWIDASAAERWLRANPGIDPQVAAELMAVGVSPEEAAWRVPDERGFVSPRPVALLVSCGDWTPARAAQRVAAARRAS